MKLTIDQIAEFVQGSYVVRPDNTAACALDIAWDSRVVKQDDVYVALPGERVDGHDFVAPSLEKGALVALVMADIGEDARTIAVDRGAAIIRVSDTASAITDLARHWRGFLPGRIIGLTGSTGKTTTKNLIRDVLAFDYSVIATLANQNNELGVPRTLLAANDDTQAAVVEMGMRGLGQIASLCEFVHPDWGVITNVGDSHVELLGSRDNIARAKAELFQALPAGGRAFLNGGNDYADFVKQVAGLEERGVVCVCYDGTPQAQDKGYACMASPDAPCVWAEDISLDPQGRPAFTLCVKGFASALERISCKLELRGLHNVQNACAAAAVALSMGMSLERVALALARALPESGRQEVLVASSGYTIINDAYNASPDSMSAALNTLCAMDVSGKRVAVLGDMGELGDFAPEAHRGVGSVVGSLSVDELICVGSLSRLMAEGAQEAGLSAERIRCVDTVEEALDHLRQTVKAGDTVLVKASHAMGLTRIVEGMVD